MALPLRDPMLWVQQPKDKDLAFEPTTLAGGLPTLSFQLPANLEAGEPPEARGLSRDQVKLMVSDPRTDQITHTDFRHLPDFLAPGDLLVINTSGTLNAALNARRAGGTLLELHLSTHLPADLWSVELRQPAPQGSLPFYAAQPGEQLALPDGGQVTLLTPYRPDQRFAALRNAAPPEARIRLWIAQLHLPAPIQAYLAKNGFPIRYKYVRQAWPASYYQTVYATETGSAEMPSAGRAFTPELITRLVARGVQFAPLILHTGVASLEEHEPPYEEYYRVPVETASRINTARAAGKRVIAVGTTVIRTLETVTTPQRITAPGEGWTHLVVTPQRGISSVDGLLTGFHEPNSTHLSMLEALAGEKHVQLTYAQALAKHYLWHEFGDLHLILKS